MVARASDSAYMGAGRLLEKLRIYFVLNKNIEITTTKNYKF